MSDLLNYHLTPNEEFLSYGKMIKFTKHQINLLKEHQAKIEQDTLYYLLKEEETLKNYYKLDTAIEQWEFLLECLEERYELLTF